MIGVTIRTKKIFVNQKNQQNILSYLSKKNIFFVGFEIKEPQLYFIEENGEKTIHKTRE